MKNKQKPNPKGEGSRRKTTQFPLCEKEPIVWATETDCKGFTITYPTPESVEAILQKKNQALAKLEKEKEKYREEVSKRITEMGDMGSKIAHLEKQNSELKGELSDTKCLLYEAEDEIKELRKKVSKK